MTLKGKNNCEKNITIKKSQNSYQGEEEIIEIKKKLNSMHNDLKKIIEQSNQEYLNIISSNLKHEFINSINGYMLDKTDETLDQRMIDPCDMREKCKNTFKRYLDKHTKELSPDNISKKKINKGREELKELRKIGIKEKCDVCFDEVSHIFENQISLIDSLKIYENRDIEDNAEISAINEVNVVKNVLDPIANKQRLQILKVIALEPKTFSTLSKLTNLRGGNLLFHIQKLQKADLIMQKYERGEYILTKKGFKIINLIANLN
ncbi:hypothetical protein MBCUT_14090 [Methanobrevibacter cuticularis]|uniref:Uncharacterized protein n=1 Tax=Methanobrevibacter cuticularis TaxID=47311 RepID=A0A166DGB7_9EURY|nr:winged helix-turn-helix domain-containing protein [Methanobrevibacter cuticularis]KZX15574.1 hypothetical protein MBCUT_14090 [Methanobrevibacter cuticularis]